MAFSHFLLLLGAVVAVTCKPLDHEKFHVLREGSCPNVTPTDNFEEPEDFSVWFTLYSSADEMKNYKCLKSNATKINSTRIHIDSVLYSVEDGEKIVVHSDVDKVSPGRFVSSFTPENATEPISCNMIEVTENGYTMAYGCKDFGNGTYSEGASIYAKKLDMSSEQVAKFQDYLTSHGSHIAILNKVDQTDCPE